MALASSLQSLTFGEWFNQSLEGEPDIWRTVQPEPGRSDTAKQSSELVIWRTVQPEPGRSDPAKQSSELVISKTV